MPENLTAKCSVCKAPAAPHLHYGAIVCYSCRAFFRRIIHKKLVRKLECNFINGTRDCVKSFNSQLRVWCKKCRFDKCLEAGMKPESVDAMLKRKAIPKEQDKEDSDGNVISVPTTLYKCHFNSCDYFSRYHKNISIHLSIKHSIKTPEALPIKENIQETLFRDPSTNLGITKYILVPKTAFKSPNKTFVIEDKNQCEASACKYCKHQARSTLDLKYHLMDHFDAGEVSKEDVLTFLHGCQECDYVASNQDSLSLHKVLIHSGNPSTLNSSSSKQTSVSNLNHIFSNFKCASCNFRATYEDDVKNHF